MKKITLLTLFAFFISWHGFSQFGCSSGVVITNGYTSSAITTPGTGGTEDWNTNPSGTSISGSYWDDDVYLFEYTSGSTTEQISMTTFSRNGWNGLGIFDTCTGTTFSGELDAVGTTGAGTTKTVTAIIPPNTTVYIATGQWGTPDDLDFDVTDFTVTQITCIVPNNPINSAISAITADFTWDAEATATAGYDWVVMADGDDPLTDTPLDNGSVATGTTSVQVTGLTAATAYDFYVQSNCGVTNGLSSWSAKVDFMTLCAVTNTFPSVTDFSNNPPNACWSEAGSGAIVDGPLTVGSSDWRSNRAYTNSSGAVINSNAINLYSNSDREWLVSEAYDVSVTGGPYQLIVEVAVTDWTGTGTADASDTATMGSDDEVVLLKKEAGASSWTVLTTWNVGNQPAVTGTKYVEDLSSIVGDVQFAIWASDGSSDDSEDYDFHIGEFTIQAIPACESPTNIQNTISTSTTADFTWDAEATATTGYNWIVMADGDDPLVDTPVATGSVAIGTTTAQTMGLTAQTDYEFYVQSDCGTANGISDWSVAVPFTTPCVSALVGNYTIGTTGDYPTISSAIASLSACGVSGAVTFDLITGSGPYNEQLVLNEVTGASATNTITFNGNGETITSATDNSNRSLFLLDGADYITLNNINFLTQDVDNNFVIQLTNGANFNSITNNTIDLTSAIDDTGSDNAGIVVSGSLTSATSDGDSGNVTITGNTIIGGYYGISISGQSTGSSMDNTISDNTIQDFYYYGIYNNDVENTTIISNDLHRESRANVSNFYALYFTGNGGGNIIDSNKLHDAFTGEPSATSTAYPIYHTSTDAAAGNANIVSNNIIYNINGAGGTNYAIYNSGSDGVYYYHNTITLDFPGATSGNTRGFYQTTTASDIEFKNNIISITRGGSGTKYCLYFNSAASSISSDNNVLHMDAPAGTNHIGYSGGAQTTLSDWQTASSGDVNSVDANPLFSAAANGQLNPNNPAVDNIGTPIALVTTDIIGNPRSVTTPDAGAYEFTPPSCIQPSGIAANNITATSADVTWTENNTTPATEWEIEYGLSNYTQGSVAAIGTITDNDGTLGETLSGLSGLTDYDVYVRSTCSSTSSSAWTGPYTFTTACSAFTAPYIEDFEMAAGSIPQCWEQGASNVENWNFANTPGSNHIGNNGDFYGTTSASGGYFAWVDDSSPHNVGTSLVTASVDVSALTTAALSFYYVSDKEDSATNVDFSVDIYDGANWNTGAFTSSTNTNGWIQVFVDLSIYNITGPIKARFVVDENNASLFDDDIAIDDVMFDELPTCFTPLNVQNTIVADDTATFTWDAETTASTGYNWVIMADGDDPTVDTPIAFGSVPSGTTTVQATGLTAETNYDFYVQSDCGSGDLSNWSNTVSILTLPSCIEPTNLVVDIVTDTKVDFSWDVEPNATSGYNWVVMADGDDPTVDTPVVSGSVSSGTTSAQATGLTGEEDYDVYIQADCGTTDGLSDWQGPVSFTTLCAAYIVTPTTPFEEDFTASSTPTCWSESGDTSWEYSVSTPAYAAASLADHTPGGGTIYAVMDGSDNTDGETGTLVTPLLDVSALTSPALTFYAFSDNTNDAAINILDVEFYDGATWNTVLNQTTLLGANWVEFNFDLNNYTITGNVQVRFTVTGSSNGGSTYYNDIIIDDVSVYEFSCATPSNPIVSNITTSSADFNWTASPDETNGYEYIVMLDGDTPGVDIEVTSGTVNTGTTMVTVGSLSPGVAYDFYVRTICSLDGPWSPVVDFTTALPPCDLPTGITNTAVTLTTADFSWTASADETNGYIWLVMADGDDPLVDMPLDDGTVATGVTTLTVNGLTPATNYDFYIQTDCGGGTLSIVSNKVDFMTDNYPCTPPASISNNAITGTTAKLTWQTNGLETGGYNWVLMADGDDPTTDMPLFNGSVGTGVTSVIISGLTPMTDYDFYVQTVCATEDSGWSSKVDITTTAPPCAEPSGVVNTDVQSSTADFDWTASPDESNGYNWVLMADGEDPTIDTPLFNGNVATGVTSVSISGLTSMTDYDFYVQTLCGSGNLSDWSTKVDITTLASACAAPTGVMNTDVQNTTADFSWAASPDETDGYNWVVMTEGEDPMVDSPVQQGAVATGVTNIQVTGLTKDTDYDFYVRTDCGSGNMSDWSTKVDFITTDLKTSISNFQNFSYYPNPVKSTLVLEASIQEMQKVSVYNLLGQEVISIQPNSLKTNLNLEKLAAGPYMIMVTINGELKTFKVIKE